MKEIKCDGLCLKSLDYKDTDKLVTLYLFGIGKVLVKARGVKKLNSKLKFAVSPLCFGKYLLNEKGGYYTLLNCDSVDSFFALSSDIDKYYPAISAIEILDKLSYENMECDGVAVLTLQLLNKLTQTEKPLNAFCEYLFDLITAQGYSIELNRCGKCGKKLDSNIFFTKDLSMTICANCATNGEFELSYDEYIALKYTQEKKTINIPFHIMKSTLIFLYRNFRINLSVSIKSIEQYIDFLN